MQIVLNYFMYTCVCAGIFAFMFRNKLKRQL